LVNGEWSMVNKTASLIVSSKVFGKLHPDIDHSLFTSHQIGLTTLFVYDNPLFIDGGFQSIH